MHAHIGSLVYEYANEPETHFAVRDARGSVRRTPGTPSTRSTPARWALPCSMKGWCATCSRTWANQAGQRAAAVAAAADALKPKATCPVCTHRAIVEEHLLRSLLDHLNQPAFAAGFGASAGLCLPHLRQALELRASTPAKARLLALQQAIWWRLQGELAEYIRKSDYQFADEELGSEADSPRRAIASLSGAKDLG